jgi:hypothetical protein
VRLSFPCDALSINGVTRLADKDIAELELSAVSRSKVNASGLSTLRAAGILIV